MQPLGPAPPHLPRAVARWCRSGGPGGSAPVQGSLPAFPRLRAERVEREQRSGERRSGLKWLFAHLDELMGKNSGRQINIIVSCQAGRRQKVTGFPCDGRKRQHQQGWKELESQGRARVCARGACVLTRVCGSVCGSRGCCFCGWEFPGHHPPVPPASLVLSTSSPVPRPLAFPAMRCIRNRLEELPWDRQGWDSHTADTGWKSLSLLTGAHETRVVEASTLQQERLQAIAEKRKRQTEIENKRRQLEDDRRQLQHLKSKALRERWLLEGAPASASEEDEAMKKQMQEDEVKTKELEETIQRLEKELETLENGSSAASTRENLAEVAAPAKEEKAEPIPNTQKSPLGTVKAEKVSSSPMKAVEGTDMMKAVVHAVSAEDGALQNGAHPLSSSEVDELLHKADEATLSEATGREAPAKVGEGAGSSPASQKPTPRREITGLQAKPRESTVVLPPGEGTEPSREQPVTMIFMGYQNVEDEDETKKVLGLEGTIKAELVVIEDAESKPEPAHKDHAPPNGTALEPAAAQPPGEESPAGQKPGTNATDAKEAEQETDVKKQRCKCCTVM
ncbi:paralemmin-1 isoform X2 [Falco peregrinus]|uniref:paralemmin-1 isoform X2 n=1 Tax=Falco peregrinus TaxID=8954 RepID=UPI00247835A4|nr:paralemmin-1 isoform X2 [Falco peregrinus]